MSHVCLIVSNIGRKRGKKEGRKEEGEENKFSMSLLLCKQNNLLKTEL